jgi:hypothetical protein
VFVGWTRLIQSLALMTLIKNLGCHITSVASESAFSTGGRVLSEHRSRLTSNMLEALMCSQDWIRNKYKGTFSFYLQTCPLLQIFVIGI